MISPVLVLFVLYFGVVYGGMMFFSSSPESLDANMNRYFSIITSIALLLIIVVEFFFFRRDGVQQSRLLFKKPVYFAVIFLFGAAFSHGLNLLVSLFNINGIFDSYQTVQEEIFAPGVVFVILRALILAPVAEELVFRGLVFRRMREYAGFWPAALVSSALFGLYHMNLPQGIYAFLFGIAIAAVYDKFRNLLAPVLVHFAANLLSVILEYTKASYPSMLVWILVMAAALAVSAVLYFFVLRRAEE